MRQKCKDICLRYNKGKGINKCTKFDTSIKDDDTICCYVKINDKN